VSHAKKNMGYGEVMSQSDVLYFLKKNSSGWYSAEKIKKALGLSSNAIHTNMFKLRYSRFVNFKTIVTARGHTRYLYKHKR
jgi:predicted ArsR family transcriptional regulator